jgi:hypothetical protein
MVKYRLVKWWERIRTTDEFDYLGRDTQDGGWVRCSCMCSAACKARCKFAYGKPAIIASWLYRKPYPRFRRKINS